MNKYILFMNCYLCKYFDREKMPWDSKTWRADFGNSMKIKIWKVCCEYEIRGERWNTVFTKVNFLMYVNKICEYEEIDKTL